MKQSIRRLFASVACALGMPAIMRFINRRRLLVLVYHGVAEEPVSSDTPDWLHVPLFRFRRQISWLSRHYDIVNIDSALDRLRKGEIRRPTACITFDDGYLNNATVALPVLVEHRAPATIYLATGLIGTEQLQWTVELETAFRRSTVDRMDLTSIGMGVRSLDKLTDRVAVAREIARALKCRPADERAAALSDVYARIARGPFDTHGHFRMLDWNDIAEMEEAGLVTFGAHTVNHEIVSQLDDTALEFEIGASCAAVRERLIRPTNTFAYPNGSPRDFDERAPRVLDAASVKWAVTTIDGLNDPRTGPFEIRRVTVANDTGFAQFRLAATGLFEALRRIRRRDSRAALAVSQTEVAQA